MCIAFFPLFSADLAASAAAGHDNTQALKVQKEARVRNMQEDRLGDEEWSLLTAAM